MRTKLNLLSLLLVVASSVAIGCGGDSNPGVDAGPDSTVDAGPDATPDSGPDGDVDGSDGGCTPTLADGCWSCPQETIQFLNQCNDGYCSAFDNTRITYPGYTPGGPYPAIP